MDVSDVIPQRPRSRICIKSMSPQYIDLHETNTTLMFRIINLKLIKLRNQKKQKRHHTGNAAQELTDLEHLISMTF